MEIKGNVKRIFDTIVVSEKFKKRELVLTTLEDKYPQDISIQFNQDNTYLLDEFSIGDNVVIKFNLKGREWTNQQGEVKYFNTIEGWAIQIISQNNEINNEQTQIQVSSEENDILPF